MNKSNLRTACRVLLLVSPHCPGRVLASCCLKAPKPPASSIEVELSDFQTMEGCHNLFPYQSARTYSDPERKQFEKDEALYASKSTYPTQAYGNLSTQYLNGIGFAFSAFTPVQYVPGTGEVRYATKATVRITTTTSKADQSRKL